MTDHLTPPAGVSQFALERECAQRAEDGAEALRLAARLSRSMTGLIGVDGGVGRVGQLEADVKRTAEILDKVQCRQQQQDVRQEKQSVRLMIMWSASTVFATAAAAAIIKLAFSGG